MAWIFSFLTALGFGGWPLVVRESSASPLATSIFVLIGTLVPLLVLTFSGMEISTSARSLIRPLLAGMLNGAGFIAYILLCMKKEWAPTFVPISLVLMVLVVTIGGAIFYGDKLDAGKISGIILSLAAVWLLAK